MGRYGKSKNELKHALSTKILRNFSEPRSHSFLATQNAQPKTNSSFGKVVGLHEKAV